MADTKLTIGTLDLEPGRLGICALPGSWNLLEDDLETIADWQADVVVTMTEQREMNGAGVGDLGQRLEAAGIEWHHLPVRDFNGLSGDSADVWESLSATLHRHLDDGRHVLVHCRAGLGRSGMVVMRLLVERGIPPEQALTRLRTVRPGAVETPTQRAWAGDGKAKR